MREIHIHIHIHINIIHMYPYTKVVKTDADAIAFHAAVSRGQDAFADYIRHAPLWSLTLFPTLKR